MIIVINLTLKAQCLDLVINSAHSKVVSIIRVVTNDCRQKSTFIMIK